jgi:hypothetical protein
LIGGGAGLVAAGGVGLGYGVYVNTTAHGQYDKGVTPTISKSQFDTAASIYYMAWPVGAVGLAMAAYGIWALASSRAPAVSIAPTQGGAMLALGGSL